MCRPSQSSLSRCVSSGKSTGLNELWTAIEAIPRRTIPADDEGRELLRLAQERIAERYGREPGRWQPLLERWRRREVDDDQAVEELLRALSAG